MHGVHVRTYGVACRKGGVEGDRVFCVGEEGCGGAGCRRAGVWFWDRLCLVVDRSELGSGWSSLLLWSTHGASAGRIMFRALIDVRDRDILNGGEDIWGCGCGVDGFASG